jgi:hypothetical protein
MTLHDLTARVRRLDKLSRGLAKEVVLWKECNDPLLYLERRAYLGDIQERWPAWRRHGSCWPRPGSGWSGRGGSGGGVAGPHDPTFA